MKTFLPFILIIISIILGYFYIYPMYQEIGVLSDQQEEYEMIIAEFDEVESRKAQLIAQYNSFSDADKKKIETIIVDEVNIPLLVLDVSGIGADHAIDIESVESITIESETGPSYVDMTIVFVATYGEFNGFMQDIEDSVQVLDMVSAERAMVEDASSELGEYTVTLRAYYVAR